MDLFINSFISIFWISGTGKTATFAISLMQRIEYEGNLNEPQGLVLAPTRELAQQIQKVIIALGDYLDVSWESVIWCKMVDYSSNPVLCIVYNYW